MPVKDILAAIVHYRLERGWSENHLAERSGISQSTISGWYRKNSVPDTRNLNKVCEAFGITLSQLFAEGHSPVDLTESQARLIHEWAKLDQEQQEAVFRLIAVMQKPLESAQK